jgi:hypothetical protein
LTSALSVMFTATHPDYRAAIRSVANVVACAASAESPDAESKRKQAATVVNAAAMLRESPHFSGLVNRI